MIDEELARLAQAYRNAVTLSKRGWVMYIATLKSTPSVNERAATRYAQRCVSRSDEALADARCALLRYLARTAADPAPLLGGES